MSAHPPPPENRKPRSAYVMWIVGVVVIVGILGYYLFEAIDSFGLERHHGTATVVGKGFHEGGTSYFTEVIGNQRVARPVATPDFYFLKLDVGGSDTVAVVPRDVHERIQVGDRVHVTYQRRRLRDALEVVNVSR